MPDERGKKIPEPPSFGDLPTREVSPLRTPFSTPHSADRDALDGPTIDMRREPETQATRPLQSSDVFRDAGPTGEDDQPTAVDRTGLRSVVQHVARLARLREELVDAARLLDAVPSPEARARAKAVRDAVVVIDALVSVADR
jgi:hypothetical protein